ncbi:MAG: hypothetical protein ACRDQA_29475 [Nocardioidaceae bacterium]
MRLPSRRKLPADVRDRLPLEPGERPLAWAIGAEGEWYVGSDRALYLPEANGFRRLGWEEVARADFNGDTDRLAVIEVADWGEPEPRTEITVTEPGSLLELLRERVTKSVVCSMYAPVRGRSGLSVVGRRSPVGEGQVTWSYVLGRGLSPEDPDVIAVAERTLVEAENELGFR